MSDILLTQRCDPVPFPLPSLCCVCARSCVFQASEDLPAMVLSLVCGVIGTTTGLYPYQSVALAAGPNLVGGANSTEIREVETLLRDTFKVAGVAIAELPEVACCVKKNAAGVYGPACLLDKDTVSSFIFDDNSTIVQTFDSSDALDDYIQQPDYGWHDNVRPVQIGLILDRSPSHPNQWTYSLRANSSDVPYSSSQLNTLIANYSKSTFFEFYDAHVLTLQALVDSYIITTSTNVSTLPAGVTPALFDVGFVPFPFPAHKQDNFKSYIGDFLGFFLVFAFMWPFSRLVRNMVEEKEKKLSEGVRTHRHTRTTHNTQRRGRR